MVARAVLEMSAWFTYLAKRSTLLDNRYPGRSG